VLDSSATDHMAAGEENFTIEAAGGESKFTMANGGQGPNKRHSHVFMDVRKSTNKARLAFAEAILVPEGISNLLSDRAVNRNRGAVALVWDVWYIRRDGDAVRASGVLDKTSVVGMSNDKGQ